MRVIALVPKSFSRSDSVSSLSFGRKKEENKTETGIRRMPFSSHATHALIDASPPTALPSTPISPFFQLSQLRCSRLLWGKVNYLRKSSTGLRTSYDKSRITSESDRRARNLK